MSVDLDRGELLFEEGYSLLQGESPDALTTSLKFVKPLSKAAKLNNGKAMFVLGFLLATGYKDISVDLRKGNKILKKAFPLLEEASHKHDSLATRFLAKYYETPLVNFVKDDSKVQTLLKLASTYEENLHVKDVDPVEMLIDEEKTKSKEYGESTNYDYLVKLISQLSEERNEEENLETVEGIKRDADSGNIRACIFLGNLYMRGEYVARDIQTAELYYEKAEDLGSIKAKYLIGYNIMEGKFASSQSISKGLNKIYEAAKAGLPEALYFLGKVYYDGKYVSRDLDKSSYYFESAYARNYSLAKEALCKVDQEKNDVFSYEIHSR